MVFDTCTITLLPSCGETLHNYISMQHWTKVVGGNKPPARDTHAACCIAGPLTGQEHPLLMVVGGWSGREVLGDVWLLDVDKGVWSEVGLLYSQ